MQYINERMVCLGDIVSVPVGPSRTARARVVMLGESGAHLEIEEEFLVWVIAEKLLDQRSIVVEWIDGNPFAHNDPRYAPVGNYMFTPVDDHVIPEPT